MPGIGLTNTIVLISFYGSKSSSDMQDIAAVFVACQPSPKLGSACFEPYCCSTYTAVTPNLLLSQLAKALNVILFVTMVNTNLCKGQQ